jgi:hypothetical protein
VEKIKKSVHGDRGLGIKGSPAKRGLIAWVITIVLG